MVTVERPEKLVPLLCEPRGYWVLFIDMILAYDSSFVTQSITVSSVSSNDRQACIS